MSFVGFFSSSLSWLVRLVAVQGAMARYEVSPSHFLVRGRDWLEGQTPFFFSILGCFCREGEAFSNGSGITLSSQQLVIQHLRCELLGADTTFRDARILSFTVFTATRAWMRLTIQIKVEF